MSPRTVWFRLQTMTLFSFEMSPEVDPIGGVHFKTVKITHLIGRSGNAVRIRIAVAPIAFLLPAMSRKMARDKQTLLETTRLVRTNPAHRKDYTRLTQLQKPPPLDLRQRPLNWSSTWTGQRCREAFLREEKPRHLLLVAGRQTRESEVDMGERLLAFVPKVRHPTHFCHGMSRDRPPISGGKQRQDSRLVAKRETEAAPLVFRHPGEHRFGAEREAPAGDFRPRINPAGHGCRAWRSPMAIWRDGITGSPGIAREPTNGVYAQTLIRPKPSLDH